MKAYIVLALVSVCFAEKILHYKAGDGIDIVALAANVEEMRPYINCIIDKADCTNDAATIKREMPEAFQTACQECNDKQKHNAKVFMKSVETNFPDEYKEIAKKFDPENKYFPTFYAALEHF